MWFHDGLQEGKACAVSKFRLGSTLVPDALVLEIVSCRNDLEPINVLGKTGFFGRARGLELELLF